jgi:hypothetical protein
MVFAARCVKMLFSVVSFFVCIESLTIFHLTCMVTCSEEATTSIQHNPHNHANDMLFYSVESLKLKKE